MFTQVIIIAGQEAHAVPVKKLPKGEVYMNQYVFWTLCQVPKCQGQVKVLLSMCGCLLLGFLAQQGCAAEPRHLQTPRGRQQRRLDRWLQQTLLAFRHWISDNHAVDL